MTDDAPAITETMERVAQRVGDPTPLVFQHRFAESPEVEGLFIRDPSGLVRGQMSQVTIESLLGLPRRPPLRRQPYPDRTRQSSGARR
ncbi:MAG: hypothetical protein QOD93_2817 [Acetobacteraceae bacterium]|jgi:hypothetical protein|nr:hypothetical protein [Acetobacteraceae bacterium]MEA2769855.1 hypothetical protein [Acetobacteraceae bacterium]